MDEGKATGPQPKWWSRPRGSAGQADAARTEDAAGAAAPPADPQHAVDMYAPPVPAPRIEPVHGTPVDCAAQGVADPQHQPQPQLDTPLDTQAHQHPPQPHPRSPWLRYDPWAAPLTPPVPVAGPFHGVSTGRGSRRGRVITGAIVLSLVSSGVGGLVGAHLERDGGVNKVELPQAPAEKQTHRAPGSVAGIAGQALPGVVTLHVSGSDGEATGTGFVLDKRGHILTNNHVVDAAAHGGPIEVTFHGGQTVKGEVVGTDGGYDLAVVRVSGVSGLDPLPLGNSDSARVGDPVVAIGAPFDLDGTVTYGIVSATHRPITAGEDSGGGDPGDGDTSYVDALQTDAPINPGNSGGPLVDARGRVIGINSAIRAADDGSGQLGGSEGGSIGLGFAIPVNQGKRVAEELINDGSATHPLLGVMLDMGYDGDGARVGGSRGKPVVPGGPSDKAGIKSGDIITSVDGDRVHSAQELIVKVRSHQPGDVLAVTLRRNHDKRSVRLTLGSAGGG